MIRKQFSRIWDLEDIHAGYNLRLLNEIGELRKISKFKQMSTILRLARAIGVFGLPTFAYRPLHIHATFLLIC